MSRMSKYLKQVAQLERVVRAENGLPVIDSYGNYEFESPISVKCRYEPAKLNRISSTGQYVHYTGVYYIDNNVDVSVQDLLDGHIVLEVYPYIGGDGELVGYEVHV